MTTHTLHNVVYARLDAILSAEKVTRVELAALSRELLDYVVATHDIDIVNRLINGLTPMNSKIAIMFFKHFLPWSVEEANEQFSRFGKMLDKPKQIKRRTDMIVEFLSDEDNTIWTWAEDNVQVEQRNINLVDGFEKALVKAIEGVDTDKTHGEPVDKADLVLTMMKHITMEEMMDTLTALETQVQAEEQSVMQEAA